MLPTLLPRQSHLHCRVKNYCNGCAKANDPVKIFFLLISDVSIFRLVSCDQLEWNELLVNNLTQGWNNSWIVELAGAESVSNDSYIIYNALSDSRQCCNLVLWYVPQFFYLRYASFSPSDTLTSGSSGGRGTRAAGWFADYLATQQNTSNLKSLVLEGGIKRWASAGDEYTHWMDGYDATVWEK
jgi:hypothetical protein